MKLTNLTEAKYSTGGPLARNPQARSAAKYIAGLMMSHWDNPFDSREFWDVGPEETGAVSEETFEYFQDEKDELYGSTEFKKMVVDFVAQFLQQQ